jgi:uncharacterized membrane protein
MTTLFIIGLCIICALLWQNVTRLQARLDALEDRIAWAPISVPEPEPERRQTASVVRRSALQAAPPPQIEEAAAETMPAPPVEQTIYPEPATARSYEPEHEWTPENERRPAAPDFAPAPAFEPAAERRSGTSFEEMFGRKLPIWAGGATLAVAGFFVVKYSIDAGLLAPAVRVILGLLFGIGLIGGAEATHRLADKVRDPRVPQALAGAGVATLYGSILAAANLYGLVGGGTAFVGLALVTLIAGLLSLRFGAASAVLGLIGGLSAPALVGAGPPNMPLLASYLALAVGGLCVLGRSQRWWWLGAAALVGGFGWGLTLILAGVLDLTAALSLGVYTLLIGIAFPLLLTGGPTRALRWAGALAGCAQMASIVATGGFAPLSWALYGFISAAAIWLSRRDERLAELPAPALAIALLLALTWPEPSPTMLAAVLTGITLIFGAPALQRLWRPEGGLIEAGQLALIAFSIALLPLLHIAGLTAVKAAPYPLLGALIAGSAAALGWRRPRDDARFVLLVTGAAVLLAIAAGFLFPQWLVAPSVALIAGGLLLLAIAAGDARVERSAWAFGAAAIGFLFTGPGDDEIGRAIDLASGQPAWTGALRWIAVDVVALLFALRGRTDARPVAQAAAVLLAYTAVAQLAPALWLPLVPAVGLAMLAYARRNSPIEAALAAAAMLSLGWAALPLSEWGVAGLAALAGEPMLVASLPSSLDALTRLLAPALALLAVLVLYPLDARRRRVVGGVAGLLGVIGLHILYKQLFALAGQADFVARGMAERTVWELLLAVFAFAVWRFGRQLPAVGLGILAFAHFAWFTLFVHNPLWIAQSVGPWLLPAYGIAALLLWSAARLDLSPGAARAREWGLMVLILFFGLSILRQIFHGPMLATAGLTEAEDIARSVLAIVAAIGFLVWGISRGERDWRVASLVLMLLAVAKVFLFDAAGLDGLLRIASFAALGFSLIGVGWLYSRYLPENREAAH